MMTAIAALAAALFAIAHEAAVVEQQNQRLKSLVSVIGHCKIAMGLGSAADR